MQSQSRASHDGFNPRAVNRSDRAGDRDGNGVSGRPMMLSDHLAGQ